MSFYRLGLNTLPLRYIIGGIREADGKAAEEIGRPSCLDPQG
jgi:hypothetical protein